MTTIAGKCFKKIVIILKNITWWFTNDLEIYFDNSDRQQIKNKFIFRSFLVKVYKIVRPQKLIYESL